MKPQKTKNPTKRKPRYVGYDKSRPPLYITSDKGPLRNRRLLSCLRSQELRSLRVYLSRLIVPIALSGVLFECASAFLVPYGGQSNGSAFNRIVFTFFKPPLGRARRIPLAVGEWFFISQMSFSRISGIHHTHSNLSIPLKRLLLDSPLQRINFLLADFAPQFQSVSL
jgi:hypothetical protein